MIRRPPRSTLFPYRRSSDLKVVDRLPASPHYGERWGRHWLDVARYADTKGYVFQEERRYAYAYTYRDYVIRADRKSTRLNSSPANISYAGFFLKKKTILPNH